MTGSSAAAPRGDGPWRLFLAIELGAAARSALARALGDAPLPGRAVAPRSWHVTLRFLGDVAAPERSALDAALGAAALGPPFELAIRGCHALPSAARARVLAAGIVEPAGQRLDDLAAAVEAAVRAAGLPPETRPLRPHVTLSRARVPFDARAELARRAAGAPLDIALPVRSIALLRSHLEPAGARYEPVARYALVHRAVPPDDAPASG